MRVKLTKDHRSYKKGQVLDVSPNEAFGLIDSGKAQITKDMTQEDYKTNKPDEKQAGVKRGLTT